MRHRRADAVSLSFPVEEVTEFAGPHSPSGDSISGMSLNATTDVGSVLGGGVPLPRSQYIRWPPRHGSASLDTDPGTPASTQTTWHSRSLSTQTTWHSRSLITQISQYGQSVYRAASRRYILRPPREVHGAASPGGSHILWAVRDPGATDKVLVPPKEQCAICLELLRPGELVQPMVHCTHLFHEACIQELLQVGSSDAKQGQSFAERVKCPLCRGTMAASSLSELPQWERDSVVELDTGTAELLVEDGSIVQSVRRVRPRSLNWDAFRSGDFSGLIDGSSGEFH
jgi:hypothetical protein